MRRNKNNIPQPGANPNQTLQNTANQNMGPRADSKRRKAVIWTAIGGPLTLLAGYGVGHFLGHTNEVDAGPNRTEQILNHEKQRHDGFYCDVATISTPESTGDYSQNVILTLGITAGGASHVTYVAPIENAEHQLVPGGARIQGAGGNGQIYNVQMNMPVANFNHPVPIYAENDSGSTTLCDHAVEFMPHGADGQSDPNAMLVGTANFPQTYTAPAGN